MFFNLTCNLSLRLEKLTAGGDNFHPRFWKGGVSKKMSALGEGGLKSSCHEYLPAGLTMFLAKKKDLKITYNFQGSISNIDLGLF